MRPGADLILGESTTHSRAPRPRNSPSATRAAVAALIVGHNNLDETWSEDQSSPRSPRRRLPALALVTNATKIAVADGDASGRTLLRAQMRR